MRIKSRWLRRCGAALLGIGLLAGSAGAQDAPIQQQPPPAGTEPGTIFVPFWTDSLDGRVAGRPGGRRVLADAVWTGVGLGAVRMTPERASGSGSVLLEEFRLSTAPRRPGEPRYFVVVARVQPFRPGASPLLEVVDSETAIQSQAWGRLLRRTGDAAEYVFVVREPIPPPPGPASPVVRAMRPRGDEERRFNLQLSLDASPPRGRVPQSTRR
jgi:hypothetical protein